MISDKGGLPSVGIANGGFRVRRLSFNARLFEKQHNCAVRQTPGFDNNKQSNELNSQVSPPNACHGSSSEL